MAVTGSPVRGLSLLMSALPGSSTLVTWTVSSAEAVTVTEYSCLASKSGAVPAASVISPVPGLMLKSAASGPESEYVAVPVPAVVWRGVPRDVPLLEFSGTWAVRVTD